MVFILRFVLIFLRVIVIEIFNIFLTVVLVILMLRRLVFNRLVNLRIFIFIFLLIATVQFS